MKILYYISVKSFQPYEEQISAVSSIASVFQKE